MDKDLDNKFRSFLVLLGELLAFFYMFFNYIGKNVIDKFDDYKELVTSTVENKIQQASSLNRVDKES